MTDNAITPSLMHYPWQKAQWQMLDDLAERERLPHALLLAGPEFVGKQQFATALSARLICDSPLAGFACGNCKQCLLFKAGNHPDFLRVEPEESGKAIRIDPVRELGQFLGKTAMQGGRKVVVINPAEAMNQSAANALLKNLEEPARDTYILLVSHELSRLPATVRSRCRKVTFPLPSHDESSRWLAQVTAKSEGLAELMEYAADRPLLALRLLESDLLQQRQAFEQLLDKVSSGAIKPLSAAEQCVNTPSVMAVDWLYNRVSTAIKSGQLGAEQVMSFRFLDKLVQVKKRLFSTANPNINLLWEELMLDWQHLSR